MTLRRLSREHTRAAKRSRSYLFLLIIFGRFVVVVAGVFMIFSRATFASLQTLPLGEHRLKKKEEKNIFGRERSMYGYEKHTHLRYTFRRNI